MFKSTMGFAILLIASVVMGCAAQADRPPIERARKAARLTAADVIGCYQLRSLAWGVAPDVQDPPNFFRLHAELSMPMYRLITWQETTDKRFAGWLLSGTDEVTAFWSTGFAGVKLIFRWNPPDQFDGRAEAFSDDGGLVDRGEVTLQKLPCRN